MAVQKTGRGVHYRMKDSTLKGKSGQSAGDICISGSFMLSPVGVFVVIFCLFGW